MKIQKNNSKPFIIAEIGSNWKSLDDCLCSIRIAKACGADAAKFQLYTAKDLWGFEGETKATGSLPQEWLPVLSEECSRVGIEFMCSAFSPYLLDAVNPFVNIHKLASAELTHVQMLEKLNSYKKPVIASVGGHNEPDIRAALGLIQDLDVVILYCVSSYPAKGTNLANISALRESFGRAVGFSDHSIDYLTTPLCAVFEGAVVIEKHVNFTEHTDTPDAGHALNRREFSIMVEAINGTLPKTLVHNVEEKDMILKHNRRLIVTKQLKAGEVLKIDKNFGIYRSKKIDTSGLSPFVFNYVNGKTLLTDKEPGDSVGPNDFQA